MGAHLSTIQNTLKERFQKCDAEAKGSLVSTTWSLRLVDCTCQQGHCIDVHEACNKTQPSVLPTINGCADPWPNDGHATAVWDQLLPCWGPVLDRQVGSSVLQIPCVQAMYRSCSVELGEPVQTSLVCHAMAFLNHSLFV